jgi:hypothetical protein
MDEEAPPAKPTQVPSWILLGFAIGALFVLALPKHPVEPPPRLAAPAPEIRASKPPLVSTVQAVFDDWGRYAVWSNDVTQVALWSAETNSYSDCFEVIRTADNTYYFRSLPALTLPVLDHGVPENSPLQFTETVRQREEWLDEVSRQNMKSLSEGVRQALGTPTEEPRTK